MQLVYKFEKPLFVISVTIGALVWLGAAWATKGLILLYLPVVLLIYLFAHSAFISHLKGNAVELSEQQFPDLWSQFRDSCSTLDIAAVPRAYLMMSDGVLNALATKFLRRKYVVLYSSVVEALKSRPEALRFYFGHELAHIKRGHLNLRWLLFPASILPLLGAAHRRAEEYTCDRHGLAASKSRDDAVAALAVLGTGGDRLPQVNAAHFIDQKRESGQFWMSFHELTNDYPWLAKRLDAVANESGESPRRHLGAWLLACFIPRLGLGAGGGAAGMLFMVAVVGILAAIAIPAYQDYTIRAQVAGAMGVVDQVESSASPYIDQANAHPETLAAVGLPESLPSGPVSAIALVEDGIELTLRSNHAAANGQTIVLSAFRNDDGSLGWDCTGGTLEPKHRPPRCRAE